MFCSCNRRHIGIRIITYAIALSGVWLLAQQAGQKADIVLHHAKVLTVDDAFSVAEAVAITGNKITAVGTNESVLAQAGPQTLKLDLKGRTVVPGLMDTHINSWTDPGGYRADIPPDAAWDFVIDWRGVSQKDDVLNQMQSYMEKYKPAPGTWLRFQNTPKTLEQAQLIFDRLTRYDLDSVTPNNPAVLDLGFPNENGLFVNSKVIDVLFRNDGNFIKKYGIYWLGKDGQPDGHLEGAASHLVLAKYMPRATAEELAPAYHKMMEEFNAQGLTTISNKERLNSIDAYNLLEKRSEQTVRMAYGLGMDYFGKIADPDKELAQFQGVIGSGTDMNWAASLMPNSADGSVTRICTNLSRAKAFSELDPWWPVGQCYTDKEYRGGGNRAAAVTSNYYHDWIMALGKYRIRMANVHVAGDRTAANLLDLIERIQKQYGPEATKNWAFDHCTVMNPRDIPRAVRLGVMFSCSPIGDENLGSAGPAGFALTYGEQYANTWLNPIKSLIDAGAKVGYSSATYMYPWSALEGFVTRKDNRGKVWGPQERVDRPTALRIATRWNADYVLKGDKLGSIEDGKLADIVVIDKDYLAIPVDQIHEIQPLLTIVDGKIVFVHTNFANEYDLRPRGAVISTFKDLQARRRSDPRTGNDGLR